MLFIFLFAFIALGIATETVRSGHKSLRLPIKSSKLSTIGKRDDPGYEHHPLKVNATQGRYLSPYTVELSVGTPPQTVHTALDLFSNKIWLNPDCYDSLSYDACCANGKYEPDTSTSATELDCSHPWAIENPYSGATGCYVHDTIEFSGVQVGNVRIGIATASWGQTAGQLGLGFGGKGDVDISIVDVLKAHGLITSRQFSIALGSANPSATKDLNAANVGFGELLFSGINTRKYAGELRKLYAHPAPHGDSRFYVTMNAIGFFDPSNCLFLDRYEPASRAYFDYTTLFSYLPQEYIRALTGFFPSATFNKTEGVYQVPCYHRSHEASVDFYFDTATISVPLRDFVLQVDDACYLGAVANTEDEAILGQSFLRAAYTAFDLDANQIYMAQYENCGDSPMSWEDATADEEGQYLNQHPLYFYHVTYIHEASYNSHNSLNEPFNKPLDNFNASISNTHLKAVDKSPQVLNPTLNPVLKQSRLYQTLNRPAIHAHHLSAQDNTYKHPSHPHPLHNPAQIKPQHKPKPNPTLKHLHLALPPLQRHRSHNRHRDITLAIRPSPLRRFPTTHRRLLSHHGPADNGVFLEQRDVHPGAHDVVDAEADGEGDDAESAHKSLSEFFGGGDVVDADVCACVDGYEV
ncbi:aspartic peptidase domain-containing protein [Astrocystis sublimbata]|nr:aspartic peptidase domain-containing protein [Astrocystis sublimbata]